MNTYEMEGFLRGRCVPRDLLVNESNAAYLVRKLSEIASIKTECDALAVENAALKSRSIKLFNLGYLRGHESTVEGYFVDVHWCDIDTYHDDVVAEIIEDEDETPATDAALAAIEARGVEKFADAWEAETARIMEGAFFYPQIGRRESVSKAVRQYIAELREAK